MSILDEIIRQYADVCKCSEYDVKLTYFGGSGTWILAEGTHYIETSSLAELASEIQKLEKRIKS